ncbi:MAG TPA: hypothetical protein VFH14_05405 [Gemmatimonadaceae bacterium]|nr:hypothetical protein [Gemmatimonadaceae bacterium]
MRTTFVPLLLAVLVSCGTERSSPGFSGPGVSGSSRAALTLRVVDDPAGAVDVTSALSRPIVSLVFEAIGGGGTTFQFTGAGQVHMSVPIDSTQTTSALFVDNVPAARFDRLTLRLVSAQLAIPNDRVPSRDMLGGSSPVIQRTMTLDLRGGSRTLVIDLNSGQWMRRVANPAPGEPAYSFDGATAFLNAIAVRTQ